MTELQCTLFNSDFPDGYVLNLPASGLLIEIYELLANGRNVSVELVKDNGDRAVYTLAKDSDAILDEFCPKCGDLKGDHDTISEGVYSCDECDKDYCRVVTWKLGKWTPEGPVYV